MTDHVAKSEFVEHVRSARSKWDAVVARIAPADALSPGFCGEWSLRDVIAHITWHEQEMLNMLERREFAGSDLWALPTDERNAVIYEQSKEGTLDDKVTESHQVFERLREQIALLTDQDLNDPTSFPGMPLEWKPWQVLAGNTYEHYEEHLAQAETFLAQSAAMPGCMG